MGIIFYLSSQPDLKSGFENWLDFILRKLAHMTEYAALAFLAWRAFACAKETEFPEGNSVSKTVSKIPRFLIYAIIFSFIFSASDEYHQTFVDGRVGSPVDVLIDSIGIIIAGIMIWRRKIIKL